jgi:hypothetical protein
MNRRQFLAASAGVVCAGRVLAAEPPKRQTILGIDKDRFLINDKLTYAGRTFRDKKVEGLLMNSRMVQGIFDDLNAETRPRWVYPDTKKWDADRNTTEFVAAMPEWRKHGLLAFTICLQGGSPEGYSKDQPWENNAFEPDGSLRTAYMARLEKILDKADELGMIALVGYFYFGQDQRLKDESAVKTAAKNATAWLVEKSYRNVMIEIANECDNARYDQAILKPARISELIEQVREQGQKLNLKVGASFNGGTIPTNDVVKTSDFVLMHGNGVKEPRRIAEMVREVRKRPDYRPKPVLFNEDDHFDFDKPDNNFMAALGEYASWGYFDPGKNNYEDGYQSPPVNWSLNTERKKAFFGLLKDMTGS